MPQLIKYIDKIAREKQRDVLYVQFDRKVYSSDNYEKWKARTRFIHWLQQNRIAYEKCGCFASENSIESYQGQLYIDIAYDGSLAEYQKLSEHLEYADGRMKIKGLLFCYVPLDKAMKNKHHDEEGFWERWAENF